MSNENGFSAYGELLNQTPIAQFFKMFLKCVTFNLNDFRGGN